MATGKRCSECGGSIQQQYMPMAEWKMSGILCGTCYSKRISKHYPGEHVRTGS